MWHPLAVQPTPSTCNSHPLSTRVNRPVVLVVDHDADVRHALRLALDDNYAVLDEAYGAKAVAAVLAQRVDLVVLDVLTPDVAGLDILHVLKTLVPNLPVIMTTPVNTVRTAVAALKLGAADYVTKPFHADHLLAVIRRALEQSASPLDDHARGDAPDHEAPRPGTARVLLVGGDHGWRATLAVALARVASVETTGALVDGLNRMLSFRPTCIVLSVTHAMGEARRFLAALNVQMPLCPVLLVSEDVYLGAAVWETFNIRGVLRAPVTSRDLLGRIGALLSSGDEVGGRWPRVGDAVGRTIDYLSRHFDRDLTVDRIAASVDISPSHLAHLFRAETGLSLRHYLTRVRIAIAQDVLATTDEKLDAIAARVGFGDASHLAHVFQRITGRPASAYRRAVSQRSDTPMVQT